MFRKKMLTTCSLCLLLQSALFGEVENVVIKWNAALCQGFCETALANQLNSAPPVASYRIDPYKGIADIQWKPNAPFTFGVLNFASRSVGFRIIETRVKVKGTIAHDQENIYIVSLGDNTRFILLGPLSTIPGQYAVRASRASYPLPEDWAEWFLAMEEDSQLVTVEGLLITPQTYILAISVEQVKFLEQVRPEIGRAIAPSFLRN